eukprot:1158241-Pelagomonas_calceolata.AAC.7
MLTVVDSLCSCHCSFAYHLFAFVHGMCSSPSACPVDRVQVEEVPGKSTGPQARPPRVYYVDGEAFAKFAQVGEEENNMQQTHAILWPKNAVT